MVWCSIHAILKKRIWISRLVSDSYELRNQKCPTLMYSYEFFDNEFQRYESKTPYLNCKLFIFFPRFTHSSESWILYIHIYRHEQAINTISSFYSLSHLLSAAMNIILLNQNSEIQNEIQISAWVEMVVWDDIEHWLAFHSTRNACRTLLVLIPYK